MDVSDRTFIEHCAENLHLDPEGSERLDERFRELTGIRRRSPDLEQQLEASIVHWAPQMPSRKRISQPDALYFAQCNLVLCSVVKFGCSRGLVSRHLLGVLQSSVVFQVNGDTGCAPGVTSNGGEKAGRLGSFSNRSPGVVPVKSSSGYCCSSRINALEQRFAAPKAYCLNVFVQDLLEQVMHWHFVLLAPFFVESQPPTCAIVIVIIDFERKVLNPSSHKERSNGRELQAMSGAPIKKLPTSPSVSSSSVPVADRGARKLRLSCVSLALIQIQLI
jgi:hypothetical protein